MKNGLFFTMIVLFAFSSCTTISKIPKSIAYKGIYDEKPLSILLMPPINRSTNVEAKEYFHSTLNIPIANAGYYVIPPFLSIEILKKESAYDAELFLNSSLLKLRELFGADVVLFTIINKWDKSGLTATIKVDVEYILKSTKTNKVLYSRKGSITYNASLSSGVDGVWGALLDITASAINTADVKYVDVARSCNDYTFRDLPAGKYSPNYNNDGAEMSGNNK